MRQAAESEIIQLTMKIRAGEDIGYFKGKEVQVIRKSELNTGVLTWADQILVATNNTRHAINNQMRELLGYSGLPQSGEKVVCKRNYWDDCNLDGDALVNGTTGIIQNPFETFRRIPPYVKSSIKDMPAIQCDFIPDGGEVFSSIEMDKNFFTKEEPCIDWRVSYQLGKLKNKIGDIVPRQFTYAYAITTHAAQGSEWDNVLVIEEKFPFDKIEHARWLYTAVSRSSKKCVLVR